MIGALGFAFGAMGCYAAWKGRLDIGALCGVIAVVLCFLEFVR